MLPFRNKMRVTPKPKIVKRNPEGYVLESVQKVAEWLWMVQIQTPEGIPMRFSHFMRDGTEEHIKEWAKNWCWKINCDIGINPSRGKQKYKEAMTIRLRGNRLELEDSGDD